MWALSFLTQALPGRRSHLSRYWPPFHTCGSSQSSSAQSSRWWCAYSSEDRTREINKRGLLCKKRISYTNEGERVRVLTSTLFTSSRLWISVIGSTFCCRMKSAIAVTDLWPRYSLFIIIPFLKSFRVGYLLILYRCAISARTWKQVVV